MSEWTTCQIHNGLLESQQFLHIAKDICYTITSWNTDTFVSNNDFYSLSPNLVILGFFSRQNSSHMPAITRQYPTTACTGYHFPMLLFLQALPTPGKIIPRAAEPHRTIASGQGRGWNKEGKKQKLLLLPVLQALLHWGKGLIWYHPFDLPHSNSLIICKDPAAPAITIPWVRKLQEKKGTDCGGKLHAFYTQMVGDHPPC